MKRTLIGLGFLICSTTLCLPAQSQNPPDEEIPESEQPKKQKPGTSTVYKWTDEQGKTHYSDQPFHEAEEITIKDVQSIDQVVSETGKKLIKPPQKTREEDPVAKFIYTKFEIISPENDSAIFEPSGVITISTLLTPGLRDVDSLKVFINGQLAQDNIKNLTFSLEQIEMGTHQLRVEVVDGAGKMLKAASNVFHLIRVSADNNG